ncbi:50S ribosomal protein L10 [Alienimonas californiensis]|uniref:Large ribosomal subunit protein uL10 n=1 Tax=Alienimonas californiensis TaxID=2527989 RepID=A0A517P8G2_9PLAN|nr:50S ribosomal protein L10 [Alienimonas californiensis]QDT15661.1 50S ribosomal protein L10 [Alienimonas californiensis]
MSKYVKGMMIDAVVDRIGDATNLLVVDVSTVDAITCNTWRLALAKQNIQALTVKNSLARRALERKGVTGLDPVLEGPSTLIFGGEDIVALSKEITKWAKEIKQLSIKGGSVEGQTLDEAGVETLSKSPSREELLATIVAQILSPGANISAALLGPGKMIASQVKQIGDGTAGPNKTE